MNKIEAAAAKMSQIMGKLQENAEVRQWNIRHPRGTRVRVRLDDGSCLNSETRSDAWQLDDGTAVILVVGITGAYRLERVEVRP